MAQFVTDERPRAYTAVTMLEHMDTTLNNLEEGKGAWDAESGTSLTATYRYGAAVAAGQGGDAKL